MTPPRRARGLFTDLTEGVYWFLVLDVLLVLSAVPTFLVWTLLSPSPLSTVLFVLAALPLLPALAAGLHACRAWRTEREPTPVAQYLRGYRLCARESLLAGAPGLLVLALAVFNLGRTAPDGLGALEIALLVVGGAALLMLVRVLSIVSRFSFRLRDLHRLAAFTLLARPLSTLALLSLGVLTLGIVLVIGEFLLLVTASLLVFALWASERPVAHLLEERFTAAGGSGAEDPRPAALEGT